MQLQALPLPAQTRASAIALTIVVHLALFVFWRMNLAPAPHARDSAEAPAIQWIRALLEPAKPVVVKPVHPQQQQRVRTVAPASTAMPATQPPQSPKLEPAAPAAVADDPLFATTPAPLTLRERVLRDIGKVDKALLKESPGGRFSSPVSTPHTRLIAGIAAAERGPHIWEAARIVPIADQGGYDRRIYKVITAVGTYCVYYDSNHTPNGIDTMKNGIKPKVASCPREE